MKLSTILLIVSLVCFILASFGVAVLGTRVGNEVTDAVESDATAEQIRADCDFVEALPDGSERHTCDVWINATGPTPPK